MKQHGPSESKVIRLRALLAIVMSPTGQHFGLEILHVCGVGHFIPKVKAAIDSILRSFHRTYSQALLNSSRTAMENGGIQEILFHHSQETELRASERDAVGLIFLSSVDSQIRHIAVELVRCVRALGNYTRELLLHEQSDHNLKDEAETIFIIDVLEEHGAVELCPSSVQEAKLEVIQWLAHIKPAELGGKFEVSYNVDATCRLEVIQWLAHIKPAELGGKDNKKLEQWLMYVACSCPSDIREGGDSEAIKELFHLIFPSLHAATMALGHSHLEICEVMFSELASVIDEVSLEAEGKPKWKIRSVEHFLACVSPLGKEWFPKHSALAFEHLLCLLEIILLMLKALLQHTQMDAAQSPHVCNCISVGREHFVLGGTSVLLEALLQSCSLPGSHPHELGQFENGFAAAEEKILAPQTSFKARSGSLQFAMLGLGAGSTSVAQPNASE
ncbi:hypothetical protein T459_06757 [Capsicum annuum]|uniref:Cell morphogenesis central region domain-containing protein n=1 Tax=Capsicum annuum TaxID=4072 RepID=A0A2G3ABP0_CAPAN|nr:hypothetical protein T459_06757 [Capsicum annuum]